MIKSFAQRSELKRAADGLHDANIEVYAIGVAVPTDYEYHLDFIASSPNKKFVVRSYGHLLDFTFDQTLHKLRGNTFTVFLFPNIWVWIKHRIDTNLMF